MWNLENSMLVAQLCLTLCDPMDCSPPGSSVHGIFQARILEWVASSFSRASSQPKDKTWISLSPALASWFFTISTTWKAQKNVKDEPITKAGTEMQMQGRNMWTQREK